MEPKSSRISLTNGMDFGRIARQLVSVSLFVILALSVSVEQLLPPKTAVALLLLLGCVSLALAAALVSTKDRVFFNKTAFIFLVIFFVPLTWMLVQILPTPVLGNAVWATAQAALEGRLSSHISIDLVATNQEIARDLLAAIVYLLAAAIAVDRNEAQWMLPALALFTAASIPVLAAGLGERGEATAGAIVDGAALAILFGFAECMSVLERVQAGSRRPYVVMRLLLMLIMAAGVIVLCVVIFDRRTGLSVIFVTACGAMTFAVIKLLRLWGLGIASISGAAILVAFLAAPVANVRTPNLSPLVAFSLQSPSSIERTQRILFDAPPGGLGGGALTSVEGLYRGINDTRLDAAPTFASKEAAELGLVVFCLETLCLVITFGLLFKSAVYRTRDWVYTATGASSLVSLGVAGLLNAGLTNLTLLLVEGAVLGLAAAHQISRKPPA